MKFFTINIVIFVVGLQLNLNSQQSNKDISPSYMLGVALTRNISEFEFTQKEISEIIKGFSDGLNNKANYKTSVNYEKLNEFMKAKRDSLIEKNKKLGEEYLKKMANEKNAYVIEDGIVYIKRSEGSGNTTPQENDTVKVHYKGILIDGTEFDSSYKRNEPAQFQLSSVISCWTKALKKMKVGEKATIGCPSSTAYGDNGIDRIIPPGASLIFDVELLDIIKNESKENQNNKK